MDKRTCSWVILFGDTYVASFFATPALAYKEFDYWKKIYGENLKMSRF